MGAVRYPAPERFVGAGGSVGYGYQGPTALLVELPLSEPLRRQLEQGVSFAVQASWLTCAELCTRERGEATLWVQSPRRESSTHPSLDHYRRQLPVDAATLGLATRRLDAHRVSIAGPSGTEVLAYFPEHPLLPHEVDVSWQRDPAGTLIVSGVPRGEHSAVVSLRGRGGLQHARVQLP